MPPSEQETAYQLLESTITTERTKEKGGHDHKVLSDDLLRGAEEIAAFLFGSKLHRRKVYHLAETSRLPVFRLGSVLCARRSVLMTWIAGQEQRGLRSADPASPTPTHSEKD